MAALCSGISYGLSQIHNNSTSADGKELIFVKLTDSAYRAIEEFQRNQSKNCSQATIQFLGNEGLISFPSSSNSSGQKFSFSLSEIEGPAGSFECIQQSQGQLDVLGTLSNKMRIHATDDVYETTKHRMAVAEENQKNKCTREIKPNQTDIGRRVKLKPSSNRLSNIPSNSTNTTSSSSSSSVPYSSSNGSSSSSKRDPFHLSSATAAAAAAAAPASNSTTSLSSNSLINNSNIANGYGSASSSSPSLKASSAAASSAVATNGTTTGGRSLGVAGGGGTGGVNGGTQVFGSGAASRVPNRVANRSNQSSTSRGGNPEIIKRPIKERLIHLLALRPYKKPELYARIVTEGVRDRDKLNIKNILMSISYLRDNTYHLNRHVWNDVNEDWPFYTEQDRQNLKRRKPQNLTPPLSSDGGSSTSGQSPTSTHNGSPPPAVKRPLMNTEKYSEGPVSKKTRISRVQNSNHDTRRGMTDSRDSANMNPRSREHHDDMRSSSSYYGSNSTPTTQESEDSGLSLSYSVLRSDAAQRFLSNSSSSTDTDAQHHHRYGEDANDLRNESGKFNGVTHDFSTEFRRIESIEQRREYKSIFDKDYAEYRKLHADMDQVSKRFAELEEALRSEEKRLRRGEERDDLKFRVREIQKRILNEYKETMRNRNHQESKRRFQYLHQKLSHIKKLVNDFDLQLTNGNGILTHSGY